MIHPTQVLQSWSAVEPSKASEKRRVWNVENDGLLKWRFRDLKHFKALFPRVFVFQVSMEWFGFGGVWNFWFLSLRNLASLELVEGVGQGLRIGRCAGISTMKVYRYMSIHLTIYFPLGKGRFPFLRWVYWMVSSWWYGRYRDLCKYTIY